MIFVYFHLVSRCFIDIFLIDIMFVVTPYWLCFCFRQKGGEHCFYCFCLTKRGRKIIYPLTFYGFDCLPLCWWLTKRGRSIWYICMFSGFVFMHIYFVLQIGEKEFMSFMFDWHVYFCKCFIAISYCLFPMHELRGSFFEA